MPNTSILSWSNISLPHDHHHLTSRNCQQPQPRQMPPTWTQHEHRLRIIRVLHPADDLIRANHVKFIAANDNRRFRLITFAGMVESAARRRYLRCGDRLLGHRLEIDRSLRQFVCGNGNSSYEVVIGPFVGRLWVAASAAALKAHFRVACQVEWVRFDAFAVENLRNEIIQLGFVGWCGIELEFYGLNGAWNCMRLRWVVIYGVGIIYQLWLFGAVSWIHRECIPKGRDHSIVGLLWIM